MHLLLLLDSLCRGRVLLLPLLWLRLYLRQLWQLLL
jgi:hypothetical protein